MSTPRFVPSATLIALALMCLLTAKAGDLETEFTTQLNSAQAGDVPAMYAVGEMYELGMGTAGSRSEALKWYRAAADQGHAQGAYQVGYAYYWGKGVDKDRSQAHAWFLRAAEGGSQAAIPYLSKMYALGQGVPQDKAKAAAWTERASTDSNLYKPPPTPEVRRARPPAPEPSPAEVVQQAPALEAPKPTKRVKPPPARTAKAEPPPARKPPEKPQPSQPPARRSIEQLLASHWEKAGRPALYLPSSETNCTDQGQQLICQSEPRRSSLLGRPYAFRLAAVLGEFGGNGGFVISYRPEITGVLQAPPGGYGEEGGEAITEQQLRERVEREPQQLICELLDATHLRCSDDRGQTHEYQGMEPKAAAAISRPPSDSARTSAADPPSPPPQLEAPEESQRSRIFGRRP